MKTLARIVIVGTALSLLPAVAPAQSGQAGDEQWMSLSGAANVNEMPAAGKPVKVKRNHNHKRVAEKRAQRRSRHLARAEELSQFQRKFARHSKVGEAKRQEAIELLLAGYEGDRSQLKRRRQLVSEIRGNRRYTVPQRMEVVGYEENLAVLESQPATPSALQAGLEQAARRLVEEMPDAAAGYESLLNVAKLCAPNQGRPILEDLLTMAAPESVKEEAAQWLERYGLIGTDLVSLLKDFPAAQARLAKQKDNIVVIYTWSADDPASIELAKQVGSIEMPHLVFFGVNLDGRRQEPAVAETAALLPGVQLAPRPRVLDALLLNRTPLLYVADRQGIVVSVTGQNGPSAAVIEASLR